MITFLHGEDETSSRKRLQQLIDEAKKAEKVITKIDAKDLDLTSLTQTLESTGLFGNPTKLIIYNFFSLPITPQKTKFQSYFKSHPHADIIFWEGKPINATSLKSFPDARIETFKLNPIIFAFLDRLYPKDTPHLIGLYETLIEEGTSPEFLFAMLIRQIRLLIQAFTEPSLLKMAPWQKTKLEDQAHRFELSHLITLHGCLYQIDKDIKTGVTPLDLETELLHFLLKV